VTASRSGAGPGAIEPRSGSRREAEALRATLEAESADGHVKAASSNAPVDVAVGDALGAVDGVGVCFVPGEDPPPLQATTNKQARTKTARFIL